MFGLVFADKSTGFEGCPGYHSARLNTVGAVAYVFGALVGANTRSTHQACAKYWTRRSCEHQETTIRRVKGVRLAELDICLFWLRWVDENTGTDSGQS